MLFFGSGFGLLDLGINTPPLPCISFRCVALYGVRGFRRYEREIEPELELGIISVVMDGQR